MTKVSVFGQQSTEQLKELKKIEFIKRVCNNGFIEKPLPIQKPKEWDNIKLLREKKSEKYDIIMAWDDDDTCSPVIFLGHWNDGVV